jgi:hypothetical protein
MPSKAWSTTRSTKTATSKVLQSEVPFSSSGLLQPSRSL